MRGSNTHTIVERRHAAGLKKLKLRSGYNNTWAKSWKTARSPMVSCYALSWD